MKLILENKFNLCLKNEIKHLFEKIKKNNDPNLIKDIKDGQKYIEANKMYNFRPYFLNLILHTDGITLVNTNHSNCWPLMFAIAEVPINLRSNWIILNGVCRSSTKYEYIFRTFCKKNKTLFS